MDLGYDSGLCLFYSYFSKVSVWGERIFLTYNFALFLFCLLLFCLGGFAAVYRKAVKCWQSSHTGASQDLSKKSNCNGSIYYSRKASYEPTPSKGASQEPGARSQAGARL